MSDLTDSQIIDRLGGTAAVARMCNVKQPSVSEWRARGIPQARRQYLELLHPEAFLGAANDGEDPPSHRSKAA
jgi:hypothetical protein